MSDPSDSAILKIADFGLSTVVFAHEEQSQSLNHNPSLILQGAADTLTHNYSHAHGPARQGTGIYGHNSAGTGVGTGDGTGTVHASQHSRSTFKSQPQPHIRILRPRGDSELEDDYYDGGNLTNTTGREHTSPLNPLGPLVLGPLGPPESPLNVFTRSPEGSTHGIGNSHCNSNSNNNNSNLQSQAGLVTPIGLRRLRSIVGSPHYIAPEIISHGEYTFYHYLPLLYSPPVTVSFDVLLVAVTN